MASTPALAHPAPHRHPPPDMAAPGSAGRFVWWLPRTRDESSAQPLRSTFRPPTPIGVRLTCALTSAAVNGV